MNPPAPNSVLPPTLLGEVRYSLPELLRDLQQERTSAAYATEKLDQLEIAKLFQKNRPRRAPRPRKQ